MQNNKENNGISNPEGGSQQSSQQGDFAANLFNERLNRLKKAIGVESELKLAEKLGIKHQSVASARKRKQLPVTWIAAISERYGVSADWLLYGTGSMKRADRQSQPEPAEQSGGTEVAAKCGLRGIPLDEEDFQNLRELIIVTLEPDPELANEFPEMPPLTPKDMADIILLWFREDLALKYDFDKSILAYAQSVEKKRKKRKKNQ